MSTLDKIPIRPPERWSAEWFEQFCYTTLAPLLPGADPDSGDVTDLIDASLVTAEPEGSLPNARALIGQPGVLTTVDHGDSVEVKVEQNGIKLGHITQIDGPSLLGAAADMTQDVLAIPAAANDTVARRVGDVIDFGELTAGMFPAEVVPDAALSDNVALYDGDVVQFSVGEFANGRISETSVTQHEAALAIGFDQLTGDQVIVPPHTTAGRPTPVGAGAMIFDTTLGLPIWHDGTNWIDAAGNTV